MFILPACNFNKRLVPSFNMARVGKAPLSFSRRYNLLLNEKMSSAFKAEGDILA